MGVSVPATYPAVLEALESAAVADGLPTPTDPAVALYANGKLEFRWLPPTFTTGEYGCVRCSDRGGAMGYSGPVWAPLDLFADLAGTAHFFADGALTGASTFPGVIHGGLGTNTASHDWVGVNHGGAPPVSVALYRDGIGTDLLSTITNGVPIRGQKFAMESNHLLLDPATDDQVGTIRFNYLISRDGLDIIPDRIITDTDFHATAIYWPAMLPLSGIDRMDAGAGEVEIEPHLSSTPADGPNLGPVSAVRFWKDGSPVRLAMNLPRGVPATTAVGWSNAINRQAFWRHFEAIDGKPQGKFYIHEISSDTPVQVASLDGYANFQITKA